MKIRNFSSWVSLIFVFLASHVAAQQSVSMDERYNNYDHITEITPGKIRETIHTFYQGKEYKIIYINNELATLYVDRLKIEPSLYKKFEPAINGIREQITRNKVQAARDQAGAKMDQEQTIKYQQQAKRDQQQAAQDQLEAARDQEQANKDQIQAQADQRQALEDQEQAKADQYQALLDQEQARADQKLVNDMISDLITDGIVPDEKSIRSITLTPTEMTVNDQKQPNAVFSRYKEKYNKWATRHFQYGGNQQGYHGVHMKLRDN